MKCDIQMTGLEINKTFAQLFCFYIPFMYLVVIVVPTLDIIFRQITTFIKVCVAFVFGFQTL